MNIHPTAIISDGAKLGDNLTIGAYAILESDTAIGDHTEIRAHAIIKRFSTLGAANVVHEGAVIGGEPQDLGFRDCRSFVRIGARNTIREGVTIHRGTQENSATRIGSDGYFMAYSHIAHNCQLGNKVILANNVALAGHVEIEDQVFISGGVVVHQFCRLGRLAMLGGNAKIVQDCLPFIITDGMPGRASGLNIIGLRRAGFLSGDFKELKRAYRTLLRSGLPLEEALMRLSEQDHPLVHHLMNFAQASQRGFCHE
ncbi:MAG: acyl-ACP--UDP-N-acetylglucosamine O-acyltransferase [Acidobacteria bacterium]|nr:acyl-ACP--UDP-N-acetylglucosamine O-acyltransferase [Acidobacteriota bacterium]